jgi:hypothetical protein
MKDDRIGEIGMKREMRKTRVNALIANEMRYYKSKVSRKDTGFTMQLVASSSNIGYHKNIIKTQRNSVDFGDLHLNQSSRSNLKSIFITRSQSSLLLNPETIRDKSNKYSQHCAKKYVNPILKKHNKLFELLEKTNEKTKSGTSFFNKLKSKHSEMIKLPIERILHEEYMKDRKKFKLVKDYYTTTSRQPESFKSLRRGDKTILSLNNP